MEKEVTIQDFMMPQFRGCKPEDYEFRADGEIVRKDRWETGIRKIASKFGIDARHSFEIDNLVYVAEWLIEQLPNQPKDQK